jgi:hypothetical protein
MTDQIKFTVGLVAIFGLLILGALSGWYVTSEHYQKQITGIQLGMAEAVQTELLEEEAKRKLAEEQHAKDQLTINTLRDQRGRVQIHIPVCSNTQPAGQDRDREARLFSERVDAAFAKLQAGVGQLVQRCDQLNIDARQFNASIGLQ